MKRRSPIETLREFKALVARVARGWETQEPAQSLACFSAGAVYMEPPDIQLFVGERELSPYFAALPPGTTMRIHRAWFDPIAQSGAFEFSVAARGLRTATHGVAVVSLVDGLIDEWCEFQRPGPRGWTAFKRLDGKHWRWTAENYPPKTHAVDAQD